MAGSKAGKVMPLLLLLGLLAGGAGWNYKRNAELEQAEFRPFGSYAEADLEALRAAYEDQLGIRTEDWEDVAGRRVNVREKPLLGAQVGEFERVQQISVSKRALAGKVAETQVSLEQVREEIGRRKRDRPIYKMYMRRIFTYQP